MRKILALILVMTAIVTLFTACKKKEDETTTQDPLYTAYSPAVSGSTTTKKGTTDKAGESTSASTTKQGSSVSPVGSTYVLTTSPDKKAPWYSTTRFVPTPAQVTVTTSSATTKNPYEDVTYTTGTITPPVSATTSSAQTTTWQNITTTTTTAATTTTEAETTEETTESEPEGIDVVINDVYIDGDGRLYASIDSEGWGSRIKSASMRVPIYIDGVEAEKPATIQISSSTNGDGFQCVFVDISKYEIIDYGGTVSFTVPEGFLANSAGTKFNYAFEVTM